MLLLPYLYFNLKYNVHDGILEIKILRISLEISNLSLIMSKGNVDTTNNKTLSIINNLHLIQNLTSLLCFFFFKIEYDVWILLYNKVIYRSAKQPASKQVKHIVIQPVKNWKEWNRASYRLLSNQTRKASSSFFHFIHICILKRLNVFWISNLLPHNYIYI